VCKEELVAPERLTAMVKALDRFASLSVGATYSQSSIPEKAAASFEPLKAPGANPTVALPAGGTHPGESLHLPNPLRAIVSRRLSSPRAPNARTSRCRPRQS
jgi:hypothetical protein